MQDYASSWVRRTITFPHFVKVDSAAGTGGGRLTVWCFEILLCLTALTVFVSLPFLAAFCLGEAVEKRSTHAEVAKEKLLSEDYWHSIF